ncbi:hypothetical protein ACK3SF_02670 [Candidatus Nanosalina sp. VS9-1]|uniref:hypothetical protein n=1 Tax=Candidatus Nanosalina sp. VS9-1 TaxID=3388566 RepID=UPI0039E0EE87
MGLIDSLFGLAVGFLTGTLGLFIGASYAGVGAGLETAAVTALAGALVWAVVGLFAGWIPLIGSIATFIVWLIVVTQTYGVGLSTAFKVAVFAWVASLIVTKLESVFGIRARAVGVPGA